MVRQSDWTEPSGCNPSLDNQIPGWRSATTSLPLSILCISLSMGTTTFLIVFLNLVNANLSISVTWILVSWAAWRHKGYDQCIMQLLIYLYYEYISLCGKRKIVPVEVPWNDTLIFSSPAPRLWVIYDLSRFGEKRWSWIGAWNDYRYLDSVDHDGSKCSRRWRGRKRGKHSQPAHLCLVHLH